MEDIENSQMVYDKETLIFNKHFQSKVSKILELGTI